MFLILARLRHARSSLLPASYARGLRLYATSRSGFLLDRRYEGSESSDTAHPARATRCSTTAESVATYSSTTSTLQPRSIHARDTHSDPRPAQIDQDRPDAVLALPRNLETELTERLAYIADWGDKLVFPLHNLHAASIPNSENSRR